MRLREMPPPATLMLLTLASVLLAFLLASGLAARTAHAAPPGDGGPDDAWTDVAGSGRRAGRLVAARPRTGGNPGVVLGISEAGGRRLAYRLELDGVSYGMARTADDTTHVLLDRGRLASLRPDGTLEWRTHPFTRRPDWHGASGGHLVALVQPDRLHILRSGQREWELVTVPRVGNHDNAVRIETDGTLWLVAHTEARCGGGSQSRYVRRPGQPAFVEVHLVHDAVTWALGPGGWVYTLDGLGQNRADPDLLAIGPAGQGVKGPRVKPGQDLQLAAGAGSSALLAIDRQLYRVEGGQFQLLDAAAFEGRSEVPLQMDAQGQAVALRGGRVVRWSAPGDWEPLL